MSYAKELIEERIFRLTETVKKNQEALANSQLLQKELSNQIEADNKVIKSLKADLRIISNGK